MVKRIGLVGAAGAIGRSVGQALVARGKPFRVIGRSAGALEASFRDVPGVERVTWNPEDAASVRAAVRGLDTLVYLVGVPYHQFAQPGGDAADAHRRHRRGASSGCCSSAPCARTGSRTTP
jgi:uncharacterized protein YbjT (DUF2867 family)